jgi:hypothetical protein
LSGRSFSRWLLLGACLGAACHAPLDSDLRERCLDELEPLARMEMAHAAQPLVKARLEELRRHGGPALSMSELAWILVPALGLQYRLRRGEQPARCHELLAAMGLMSEDTADAPLSLEALRLLVNRAALPETELLLPGSGPLPDWLRGAR